MDPPHGWNLRPVAEPVSYYDTGTRQWTSGSFDTAMKSEHPAVVSDTAASSAFAAAGQHGSASASTPTAHGPWAVEAASFPMHSVPRAIGGPVREHKQRQHRTKHGEARG